MARKYAHDSDVLYRSSIGVKLYPDRDVSVFVFGPYPNKSTAKAQIAREKNYYLQNYPDSEIVFEKVEKATMIWNEI